MLYLELQHQLNMPWGQDHHFNHFSRWSERVEGVKQVTHGILSVVLLGFLTALLVLILERQLSSSSPDTRNRQPVTMLATVQSKPRYDVRMSLRNHIFASARGDGDIRFQRWVQSLWL